jgi:hypothetical protein
VTDLYWMSDSKWADTSREALAGDFDGDGRTGLLLQAQTAADETFVVHPGQVGAAP